MIACIARSLSGFGALDDAISGTFAFISAGSFILFVMGLLPAQDRPRIFDYLDGGIDVPIRGW
jgi:hypothetical protein